MDEEEELKQFAILLLELFKKDFIEMDGYTHIHLNDFIKGGRLSEYQKQQINDMVKRQNKDGIISKYWNGYPQPNGTVDGKPAYINTQTDR